MDDNSSMVMFFIISSSIDNDFKKCSPDSIDLNAILCIFLYASNLEIPLEINN